jgi:hypothetical protein
VTHLQTQLQANAVSVATVGLVSDERPTVLVCH